MKNRSEVEKLKKEWLQNPGWDLSHVKGFEEYRDELNSFQFEFYKRQGKKTKNQQQASALIGSALDDIGSADSENTSSETHYLKTISKLLAALALLFADHERS